MSGLAHPTEGGVENLRQAAHQPGNRRVRADGPALAAGGAVLRHPGRVLGADGAHVAKQRGGGGHEAQRHEWIGEVVVAFAARVEAAGLRPEALDVRQRRGTRGKISHHDGHRRDAATVGPFRAQRLVDDLGELVEAALDHSQVVLDHARAAAAELALELHADRLQQPFLIEALLGQQRGRGEERALEGDALHAQLEICVGGFLPRDPEGVEVVAADVALDDLPLITLRNARPHLRRLGVRRLDDEQPAVAQPAQRIAVIEHVGIRRQHHVDVAVLAVDADRLWRRGQVERGRLTLLLGAVLGVGFDVIAEQVEQRRCQVLAGGDGAPAADGVHAQGHATRGHEVGVLAALDGQPLEVRVVGGELLLLNLLFRMQRSIADEIDAQVVQLAPGAVRQHVFHRADEIAGGEIPAAQAERGRVDLRQIAQPGIGG